MSVVIRNFLTKYEFNTTLRQKSCKVKCITHLLDRTSPNIIFIWSGKVILGEGKPTLSARFIDPDQEAIYQVACSTPLYKLAYCVIYFRTWNCIVFELATV